MTDTANTKNKQVSFGSVMRGMLPSILINGLLPYLIYQYCKSYTHISDLNALILSAIPSIIYSLYGIIRDRKMDMIAGFALASIGVSIVAAFIGGDPRIFLIRESLLTVVLGIVCLISLVFSKPLWFYIIRYFAAAANPAGAEQINQSWQYPAFRTYTRVITVVWGITFTGEFLLRIILVYSMSISQFLIISPFIFYGITIAVIAYTFIYANRLRRKGEERRRQEQEALAQ